MSSKSWKTWIGGILRLGIGLGIVAALLVSINKGSQRLDFTITSSTVEEGSFYGLTTNAATPFIVLQNVNEETTLTALGGLAKGEEMPESGSLYRIKGRGPDALAWSSVTITPCGLQLLGESFREAARNWGYLLLALIIFVGCLGLTVTRWRMLLSAQGLNLTRRKAWAIMFIGHFFNAFMFGSTGGDVVKAYYAARETGHKKTEAATTVYIDRVLGMISLIILAVTMMFLRLDLYTSTKETRYAFFFIGTLALACIGGVIFMAFFQKLIDRFAFIRRLTETSIGKIFHRIYTSFYVCFSHPPLFAKAFGLSLLNQFMLCVLMFVLGRALLIDRPFIDFLALSPTINSIGSVPVTPGGLGLREYAAVTYFGVVGVLPTKAMPLSLAVYAVMLFWSMVGGVVFMLYSGASGGMKAIKQAVAEDG